MPKYTELGEPMTDYGELRAALEAAQGFGENCFVALNSAEIRALLAERDALREALGIARDFVAEALAQERVAYRWYESVSSIAVIERDLGQIDAALAQGEV